MPTYVLGTHTSHDGSACLLKDGRIVAAIEKERITRIKHDGGNDNAAIEYCLQMEGIRLKDVELVVQNANFHMFERTSARPIASPRVADTAHRTVTISHHLAHAFSTIGPAPFTEMAALVIDGCGNSYADCMDMDGAYVPEVPANPELEELYFEKDSYYEYQGGRLRTVVKDFSPYGRRQPYHMFPRTTMHSIGGAYLGVSEYVFRGIEDPGKLMGLSPYGKPGVINEEMFDLREGRVFLNYKWMERFDRPAVDGQDFRDNFQYYADIAYWCQREIERALLYIVGCRYDACPCENLGYSGGVALNAVANTLIRSQTKFKDVYIQPAAGDNGLAVGCAYYGWLEVLHGKRLAHDRRSNFGRRYSHTEIKASLDKMRPRIDYEQRPDIIDVTAGLLASGKIVGWFHGSSEFGPRALGNRSILALPFSGSVRDFINRRIKFREDFRPFAPSVIADDANIYFRDARDSPYMLTVAPVRPDWRERIPAVVHKDGTARLQTVHREIAPRYYELLQSVKRHAGISVLLNTSLNRRGEPMAETPADAASLFLEGALDALIIEDWLVLRTSESAVEDEGIDVEMIMNELARAAIATSVTQRLPIGVLQLVISDIEAAWTFDLRGRPRASKGRTISADYTIGIRRAAMEQLLRNPGCIEAFYRAGDLKIAGIGPPHTPTVGRILAEFRRLLTLVRDSKPQGFT